MLPFRILVALLLVAAFGCSAPVTQIIIVADSDLMHPGEYSGIKISGLGPAGTSEFANERFSFDEPARPVATSIYPLLDEYSPLTITVYAEGSDMTYPPRIIETSWIAEESLVLEVFLSASCMGVTCGDGETCIDGACASAIVDPATLPKWDGSDPFAR